VFPAHLELELLLVDVAGPVGQDVEAVDAAVVARRPGCAAHVAVARDHGAPHARLADNALRVLALLALDG